MGMMSELAVSDKLHRRDEPNLLDTEIIRDHAERCRAGCWVLVGAGTGSTWKFDKFETGIPRGSWDRKAFQTSAIYSGS